MQDDVVLVNIPNYNIKHQLVRNSKMLKHLAERAHFRERRMSMTAPLRKYRQDCHNGEDYEVMCRILAVKTEISAREVLEAL